MRQPKLNPENLLLALLAARRRSRRKKHRAGRGWVLKLPRKLKKTLKKEFAWTWKPAQVRIESYDWVSVECDPGEWDTYREAVVHHLSEWPRGRWLGPKGFTVRRLA